MGRRKSYDRSEVVARALPVFWSTGFEATAMAALEEATGVNKFGLYETFGNKWGLYLACIDAYREEMLHPAFRQLEPTPEGTEAFLEAMIQRLEANGERGCFLLNSGVEAPGKSTDIDDRVTQSYALLTERVGTAWSDPERAEAFTALVQALMLGGRLGTSAERMRAIVRGARRLWNPVEPVPC